MQMIVIVGILHLLAAVDCQHMTDVVETDTGPVRGRKLETAFYSKPYSAFKGIPFAEKPIGDRRFKDAVPPKPWTNVLNATDDLNFCAQYLLTEIIGQEDCLYIHVYTPVTDFTKVNTTKLKPVMISIYGGAFIMGFGVYSMYGPDAFMEQDLVVVLFNYRTDIFGFLALDVPDAKGNQGLKDQLLALKWVQKNIAAFGGDPNSVTLSGQSAGAASVGYHMLSPQSQGLYHKTILQSGSPLCPWAFYTRKELMKNAFKVGAFLGYKTLDQNQLLEKFKEADTSKILTASRILAGTRFQIPNYFPFGPTITDDFLDEPPITKMQKGNFSNVPVLMGFLKDEALTFALVIDSVRVILYKILSSLANLSSLPINNAIVDVLNNVVNATEWEMIKVNSAYTITAPVDLMQRYFIKHMSNPVYYYHMSKEGEGNLHNIINSKLNGTAHLDDIPFLFYLPFFYPTDPMHRINVLRYHMVSMWSNFIQYGNPTPNFTSINGAVWEPSGAAGLQLDINWEFSMGPRMMDAQALAIEALWEKALPALTNSNV